LTIRDWSPAFVNATTQLRKNSSACFVVKKPLINFQLTQGLGFLGESKADGWVVSIVFDNFHAPESLPTVKKYEVKKHVF
jgi:hypothetical protein